MKDPLDNRPDAYLLLNCSEDCKPADARHNYAARLSSHIGDPDELLAARDIITNSERRVIYDLFRYNYRDEQTDNTTSTSEQTSTDIKLPIFMDDYTANLIDPGIFLSQISMEWRKTDSISISPLEAYRHNRLPRTEFEFDK